MADSSISDPRPGEVLPSTLLPILSTFLRVIRRTADIDNLEATLPALEKKAISNPFTLTDPERRLLLDFPDVATEASYLQRSTDLSRDALISKASSTPASLTDAEITLLRQNFWLDITRQESLQHRKAFNAALKDAREKLYQIRKIVYQPNEEQAILNAMTQRGIRMQREDHEVKEQAVQRAMPNLLPWQQRLVQESFQHWGYVCFVSNEVQRNYPVQLETFWQHFDSVIWNSFRGTGVQDVLGSRWYLQVIDELAQKAPFSSSSPSPSQSSTSASSPLSSPLEVRAEDSQSILSSHTPFRRTFQFLRSQANALKPGLLTNTFLLVDSTCMDSVLDPSGWLDNMRVLALEADYPRPGKTYADGYDGYTWVRLEHVPFNFYEMRYLNGDDDDGNEDSGGGKGMQRLWQAAQWSRNRAFVSCDEMEAGKWAASTAVTGPLKGSFFREHEES